MRIQARSLLLVLTFILVTGLMLAITGVTFARIRLEPSKTLQAHFSDSSGLRSGEDVRASGVTVGSVKSIRLDRGEVLVTFDVPRELPVTTSTQARIRYANLTGDRYLDLTRGAPNAPLIPMGWTIPLSHTQPALDHDNLFAGFDPLMRALDPNEINRLTANILAVTHGQAGAIRQLLANVGRFTGRLAERDKIIGETIRSLSRAVGSVDRHRADVERLIVGHEASPATGAPSRRHWSASIGLLVMSAACSVTRGPPSRRTSTRSERSPASSASTPKRLSECWTSTRRPSSDWAAAAPTAPSSTSTSAPSNSGSRFRTAPHTTAQTT